MIGVAAVLGVALIGLTYLPGGLVVIATLVCAAFVAEFIAPFLRGSR